MDSLHMPSCRIASVQARHRHLVQTGKRKSKEGQSIFELVVTANPISNCVHSNKIVRYLKLNSDGIFLY